MVSDPPIRLLIVDDQALVRGAVGALLEIEDDLEVAGYAANATEAVVQAAALHPNVCLMDIQMPGIDGIEATRRVLEASPHTSVLIVTTFARPGYLLSALKAGATGFIVKDAPPEQLADAVRRVHQGLRVVDPALAEASLFEGESPLSEREQQILRLAGEGQSAAEIAASVYLSAGTVRNHLSSAIGKLGAANRGQAARIAREKGWI